MARPIHLAPAQTSLDAKAIERSKLEADYQAWLAQGGVVQQLMRGDRSEEKVIKRRGKAVKKKFDMTFASRKAAVASDEEE